MCTCLLIDMDDLEGIYYEYAVGDDEQAAINEWKEARSGLAVDVGLRRFMCEGPAPPVPPVAPRALPVVDFGKSFFEILGVSKTASQPMIKKAFLRLSLSSTRTRRGRPTPRLSRS